MRRYTSHGLKEDGTLTCSATGINAGESIKSIFLWVFGSLRENIFFFKPVDSVNPVQKEKRNRQDEQDKQHDF